MSPQEYNTLVSQHADGLYRFLLKSMKDESTAQDLVQEAFERVWLNVKNISAAKSKSYLFSTGYHLMIDFIRKHKRICLLQEFSDEVFTETYSEEYKGTKELLEAGLEKLPLIQKSVLLLCDYEGYTYKEIGGITGLKEPQVKVYIYRARKFLRSFITKMEAYEYVETTR